MKFIHLLLSTFVLSVVADNYVAPSGHDPEVVKQAWSPVVISPTVGADATLAVAETTEEEEVWNEQDMVEAVQSVLEAAVQAGAATQGEADQYLDMYKYWLFMKESTLKDRIEVALQQEILVLEQRMEAMPASRMPWIVYKVLKFVWKRIWRHLPW
eukprot:Protomagalhaensia_wolfi_Nauph_80__167@NODE_1094_length_1739_cov_704_266471_g833_i0_p1_GENE_NODE_1094_length_1739_cov_704_266471_g833_i0NODE_1094_length_1739_cov_704_266471_g833_i0_p1_ORF_typecomplete_len156_score47_15Pollen_allerg_2/PF01620_16/0_074_NODE_1094_length_1739_cov_704_266471_g833_i0207674